MSSERKQLADAIKKRYFYFSLLVHTFLLYFIIYLFLFTEFKVEDITKSLPVIAWYAMGISYGNTFRPKLYEMLHPLSSFLVSPLFVFWPALILFRRWD